MPATRELTWDYNTIEGSLDVHIEVLNKEEVYFTDQEPRFKIIIENNTDFDIEHSHFAWVIAIGQGRPEPFVRSQSSDISIPAGDEYIIDITDEHLSLEGHGIIALGEGGKRRINKEEKTLRLKLTKTDSEDYRPLATFSVWDREHYEVVHEQPQRTQQFSLFASFGIVIFAVVQLGIVLGYPLVGLIGGLAILSIYWYSGYLGELIDTLLDHRSA